MNATNRPWYRHAMVWLVIAPPAGAVLAGIVTLILILKHPDPVLSTHPAPVTPVKVANALMPPTD